MKSTLHPLGRQRGIGLIDALLAAVVLALGIGAATRLHQQMRHAAEASRERGAATRLAQAHLERIDGGADLVDHAETVGAFRLTRSVAPVGASASAVELRITWAGRSGAAQQITLSRIVAAIDPGSAGAVTLAPAAGMLRGPHDRAVDIPLPARDLGDGRSAFKPVEAGSEAWVFVNRGGAVLARCTGIAAATPTRALTAAGLGACDATPGLLLAGSLRFTSAPAADPGQANEAPPDLLVIAAAGGSESRVPVCLHQAVAIGSERYARYHCIVYPMAGAAWSGRVTLQPIGWTIGATAADRRVCRYGADRTAAMQRAVTHHNLLVVPGSQACPGATAAILDPVPNGVFADLGTVAHQP